MTLWRSIRGPLFAWLFFMTMFGRVIYDQMGNTHPPKPEPPSCEVVTVTYKSPGGWAWEKEEVQCPGPNGKVRLGW